MLFSCECAAVPLCFALWCYSVLCCALQGREVVILGISAALTTRDDKRFNVNCEDAVLFIMMLMTKSTENDNMSAISR